MIFVYLLCLALACGVTYFVGRPLVRSGTRVWEGPQQIGFADEADLRATLALRDALVERCLNKNTAHVGAQTLSPARAEEALLFVCQRLRKANLPLFSTSVVSLIFGFFVLGTGFFSQLSQAQPVAPGVGEPSTNAAHEGNMPRIPPPVEFEPGVYFSRVHQFLLAPRQGELHFYYTTVFAAPAGATSLKIAIPVPKGFGDVALPQGSKALLAESVRGLPVFEVPTKPGATDFRVEFSLPASSGTAHIENINISHLPGLVIFLFPEHEGTLRNFLEAIVGPTANVWPARIATVPTGFQNQRQQDEVDPQAPNFAMFQKMPPQFTRQLVRMPNTDPQAAEPYPVLDVTGIVPARAPLIALSIAVAGILLGIALVTLVRQRTPSSAS